MLLLSHDLWIQSVHRGVANAECDIGLTYTPESWHAVAPLSSPCDRDTSRAQEVHSDSPSTGSVIAGPAAVPVTPSARPNVRRRVLEDTPSAPNAATVQNADRADRNFVLRMYCEAHVVRVMNVHVEFAYGLVTGHTRVPETDCVVDNRDCAMPDWVPPGSWLIIRSKDRKIYDGGVKARLLRALQTE